jgi:hypothetical protein
MTNLDRRLSELLAEERTAALGADLETLEALQERKRALLDRAQAAGEPVDPRLAEMARANIALIRRLAALQLALAGVDETSGYDAGGHSTSSPLLRRARGVL